ncbi:MAG: insulinase family protein [Betaproteobacteria bacterium]|nr:insulinase family protein [Betaproteobacteria bacterium]
MRAWVSLLRLSICAAVFLGGGLAYGPAKAQVSAPAPVMDEGAPRQFTLANGMSLLIKVDRRAPTAVHMLWVRVGSIDEVDGTSGVAHVLEHMMFKGTPTVGPGEYSKRIAALGGRDNAFTSRDATAYHQQIPAARLREVMELEADRFARNVWTDDEFKREIEVVKEERRQRIDDSPRSQMFEAARAVMFTASPYRRPIIGWMNDLDMMTPQDVREFYQRWYVPGNAAVVVAGDVDIEQVRRWAEQYYGAIPARALPARKPRLEPPQSGPRRLEHRARGSQPYVSLMYKVPQLDPQALQQDKLDPSSRDALALTVLAWVLDGHSAARLDRTLVQGERPAALRAGAYNGLYGRGPQVFVLDGVPAEGISTRQLMDALREQVARVAREGIAAVELERVKIQWLASQTYKRDALFSQANEMGSYWLLGFPIDADRRLVQHLRSLSAADVQSVAQRYFGDDQLTEAVLVPQSGDGGPPVRRGRNDWGDAPIRDH